MQKPDAPHSRLPCRVISSVGRMHIRGSMLPERAASPCLGLEWSVRRLTVAGYSCSLQRVLVVGVQAVQALPDEVLDLAPLVGARVQVLPHRRHRRGGIPC